MGETFVMYITMKTWQSWMIQLEWFKTRCRKYDIHSSSMWHCMWNVHKNHVILQCDKKSLAHNIIWRKPQVLSTTKYREHRVNITFHFLIGCLLWLINNCTFTCCCLCIVHALYFILKGAIVCVYTSLY